MCKPMPEHDPLTVFRSRRQFRHAPIYESVTQFGVRVAKPAKLPDLLGRVDEELLWKALHLHGGNLA